MEGFTDSSKASKALGREIPFPPFFSFSALNTYPNLNLATTNSEFNFHPKCIRLGISHLAFPDDLMLFSRGDVISVRILMDCLRKFKASSGLSANVLKSSILPVDISESDLNVILSDTYFSKGELLFRYLDSSA